MPDFNAGTVCFLSQFHPLRMEISKGPGEKVLTHKNLKAPHFPAMPGFLPAPGLQ